MGGRGGVRAASGGAGVVFDGQRRGGGPGPERGCLRAAAPAGDPPAGRSRARGRRCRGGQAGQHPAGAQQ
ncbi:hypothetical protein G6F50_015552 [Rhizopus delemar]|uniref:Uncharacterized protein n=1 Tax=Rhizopus delemar TaxID=936053 RepID=A0A9P6XXD8_9FUNG|nr:hypothetical protein G6F50_015552 [Rhizopus delemar]